MVTLQELIENEEDLSLCGVILAEVLQGIRSDTDFIKTKEYLGDLIFLPMRQTTFLRSAEIYRSLRKQGITIRKPVDCMIHGLFTKLMRPGGILLGTLIFATLLTACRSSAPIPYKIETTYHAAGGYTVDTMTGNRLGDDEGYELNAARYSGKDGTVNYALGVFYSGEQWMFIEPGVSLILWVDSHRFGLKGQGSLRDRKSMGNGYVREIAKYPVAPEILQKMATAGAVKIQIIGRNFVTQKFFTSQNLENFREFVDTYVK